MAIKKDCIYYKKKSFSIGEIDYCDLFDDELIEDANDCDDTECEKYEKISERTIRKKNNKNQRG